MAHRIALSFLAVASPLVLVSFFIDGALSDLLFTTLAMAFPVALIVVGVSLRGGIGKLAAALVGLFLILECSAAAMLLLRGRVLDGPWVGGLPMAAAIQIYGLFLGPLLLVAVAYALSFDRSGIREEDLQKLELAGRDGEVDS